jgi:glycosyltransferase involved in cell wall biosynthesis
MRDGAASPTASEHATQVLDGGRSIGLGRPAAEADRPLRPQPLRQIGRAPELIPNLPKSAIVTQVLTPPSVGHDATSGQGQEKSQARALKVLVAVPYFPPHKGGTELYALNIAQMLSADFGWNVVVVTTAHPGCPEVEHMTDRLTVYRLPYRFKLSNSPLSLAWFWQLRRLIRVEAPDLISAHAPVPGLADMVSLVAGHRPVVLNYHSSSMRKGRHWADPIIWVYEHIFLKVMFRRARKLIGSSDFVRDGILRSYSNKAMTITPGVDLDVFQPADTLVDAPHVLFVGSLNKAERHKNLHGLLAACKEVRTAVPDLRLTVVGDGDGRSAYQDLAVSLGLGDITRFLGHVDRPTLADAYRQAAVFALPSTNDSFGMVNAEAMASGLPVVSTLVGGIPTVVDDEVTGLLVEPTDTAALAQALRRVLGDRELAIQLGKAGREKVVRSLSWSSRGELTDRVFRDVLAQRQ